MKIRKRLLGVDPGTLITGWGVIEEDEKGYQALDFGCIRPKPTMKLTNRYRIIFESIQSLIKQYQPTALAIETQFVKHNVQSALKLGMARGVIVLAATLEKIPVFEYAPTKIKLAVTGRGQASKFQVQAMIKQLLNLDKIPEPEDAADALACAITHAHHERYNLILNGEM